MESDVGGLGRGWIFPARMAQPCGYEEEEPGGGSCDEDEDYFYQQAKREAKAREHERAMTFEPHVPQD